MKEFEFEIGDICIVTESDYHNVRPLKKVRVIDRAYDLLECPIYKVERVDEDAFKDEEVVCKMDYQLIFERDLSYAGN